MAKKKKSTPPRKQEFGRNPFSNLKGFAVSGEENEQVKKTAPPEKVEKERPTSFADQMAELGVERINSSDPEEGEMMAEVFAVEELEPVVEPSDEEQFLQAMGELQVNFSDSLPADEQPPTASAGRMKQLKQGKLVPEATLDLHGLKRSDVAEKLRFFLQNADRRGWQTLLVITGRGLHSAGGEPVLRNEAERLLASDEGKLVAEWGRAPKQYGADGALVLFLRKKNSVS